jgi:fatty acid desaturase
MQPATDPAFDALTSFVPVGRQPGLFSSEELRGYMKIKPWRVALDIAMFWAMVLGTFAVAFAFPTWWVWALCFLAMGFLQNAIITWTHEASHSNLNRNRKRNDRIADFLLAGPAGISVDQYRWHHVAHHKYLGDPEKEVELAAWLCVRGGHLFSEIARHLLGMSALNIIRRKKRFLKPGSQHPPPPPRSMAAWAGFIVINGALAALCWWQGFWFLYPALWVAPLFTIGLLLSNFRTVVEHQTSSEVCDRPRMEMTGFTRVIECSWIEHVLIAPVGLHYHFEHHLFPSVPYHRLREVRAALKRKGFYDQPGIVKERGYLRTVWRLSMRNGYGIRMLNPFVEPPRG